MSRTVGAVDDLLAGRYRLTDRLAVGGMGEVWCAVDVLLDRTVAVKTLRAELVDDEEFRARFRAEARHTARLSHPGIASVYDFGEQPDRAWLVMELVAGEPLSALLRRAGRLSAAQTLDVVAQTAAALQAAHEVGLVHRDVKPGNLIVQPDGHVKVTDFGISAAADAVPLTRTGQVLGTAFYLSPEQAAGGSGTPSSDLYALGVVAYECLAGVRPFVGDSPVAVALAHLQSPVPPLPDDVPAAVRSLVQRLLAKDSSDRPGSAAELVAEAQATRRALPAPAAPAAQGSPGAPPAATQLLPVAGPHPDESLQAARPTVPRRPAGFRATSPRTQRRAVRATAVLLALLAVGLGLSGAWNADATVPGLAPGTPEAQAVAAVVDAGLDPATELAASTAVPRGRLLSVRPPAGTELERGDEVVLVVSSGPPTARVVAADLVGRPAAQARSLLAAQGLLPRLIADGRGGPVGAVSAVSPVGEVEVGTRVDLHVVPAPAPEPASAPRTGDDAEEADPGQEDRADEGTTGGDDGKGKGEGKDEGRSEEKDKGKDEDG